MQKIGMISEHKSVLKKEVLQYLKVPEEKSFLLDCTTGEGGHTLMFLENYKTLYATCLDRDAEILMRAEENLRDYKERYKTVNVWFSNYLKNCADESYDAILFDLGISMYHYKRSGRGFSFSASEKLDMRLDTSSSFSAYTIVNSYTEEELAALIYKYGEERFSRRIAGRIVRERKKKVIERADELRDIILQAVPTKYRYGRINAATKTFQAIRIEVNDEINNISSALKETERVLKKGGHVGVITFHSLEDRVVKNFFKESEVLESVTKKPICPTEEEKKENKASRSAKLRVARRTV